MLQVKAPAGVILRLTPDGKQVQAVAGGLHDAADLAFDELGELFAQDSEAAADAGFALVSACGRVSRVARRRVRLAERVGQVAGALRRPPPADAGDRARRRRRAWSFYNHYAFPEEYRNALFIANWTHGRISALKLKPNGGSYTAASELFVDDPSLHVTDHGGRPGRAAVLRHRRPGPGGRFVSHPLDGQTAVRSQGLGHRL